MNAAVRQSSTPRWPCQVYPDLRFAAGTRVENACATGSAAIHMGLNTFGARARFVLVVREDDQALTPAPGRVRIKASLRRRS